MYLISNLVLKTSGVILFYSLISLVFLHLYRKKFNNIWIALALSLITGLVPVFALYNFQPMAWYAETLKVIDILIAKTNRGIEIIISTLGIGLFLIFIGNYLTEKFPKQEYRSFYHAAYGFLALGLISFSQDLAFAFLSLSISILFFGEYLRQSDDKSQLTIYVKKVLNKPLRSYEKRGYVASFSFIGGLILVTLFIPQIYAFAAALILSVGDPAAALVGRRYGNTPLTHNPDKTLEGSLSMLIVSIIALQIVGLPIILTFLTVTSATIFESLQLKVGDNLLLPVVAGIIMVSLG